jgi:hypothetical protein
MFFWVITKNMFIVKSFGVICNYRITGMLVYQFMYLLPSTDVGIHECVKYVCNEQA